MPRRRRVRRIISVTRPISPEREALALQRDTAARVLRARARDRWTGAWRYATGSEHIPKPLEAAVKERDGHACVWCASAERLEMDHAWPVRLGGLTVAGNLQTLCRACNRWKGRDPVVLHRDAASGIMHAHRVHVPSGFVAFKRWPTVPDVA